MGNKESKNASSQTKNTENVEHTVGVESEKTETKVAEPKEEIGSKEEAGSNKESHAGAQKTDSN